MKNKEAERQMMERLEQQRKLELLTCALNLWLHIIVVYLNVLNIVCINLTHCDWRNLRTNCLPMSDGSNVSSTNVWIFLNHKSRLKQNPSMIFPKKLILSTLHFVHLASNADSKQLI